MGIASNIAKGLRTIFGRSPARHAAELSKGLAGPNLHAGQGGLLSAFGETAVHDYLRLDHDLLSRYAEYEDMDEYTEISKSLDIYADDATQPETQRNRVVWVTSKDRNIELVLDELFHRTLGFDDDELWGICRELCKTGNEYEELLVGENGVVGIEPRHYATMRRVQTRRGELLGYIQDFQGATGFTEADFKNLLQRRRSGEGKDDLPVAFEEWEVVHFRLRGKQRGSVYGHSVLEPARWAYRRLQLLEDAALVYRLQRAPERFAFYMDTGDMPPAEALAYLQRMRMQHRKKRFIDPQTGKLNLQASPIASDEDFYIPVFNGQESTRIEVLGAPAWQSMDDIEYFRDKLFAGIGVPKAYLGQEDGIARAVLSSEDVRFARSVLRVQRELKNGLRSISRVHLAALGVDPYELDYDIWMTVPSSIFELAQIEVRNARADLAQRMQSFVSLHWILSKVFGMSDDEIEVIVKQRGEDVQRDAANQQAAMPGMGGGQPGQPPGGDGGGEGGGAAPEGDFAGIPGLDGAGNLVGDGIGGGIGGMGAPGSTPNPAEALRRMRKGFALNERRRSSRLLTGRGGISEQELFRGNREHEKRAEAQLEKILKNDKYMTARLNELGSLLHEMRATSRRH